jgi:hypothetical protein
LLNRLTILFWLACATLCAAERPVDFNRDIRPILSDNCFFCHGPDESKRMAGVRLDTQEDAFARRGESYLIVPGDSAKSLLYQRISHPKKPLRMPPVTSGFQLTEAQIALLKRWIDEGAKWQTHWAFVPPARPDPPAVRAKSWPRNPIDNFILARLEKEGLKPSPRAGKATLLRRLSFDLTGLPPAPAEIDAFLADKSPDAYEKVVERLLASPRYGERMTMQWLDLARYADTHGYHIDSHRDMWPWRDWVISAFNRNLPFNDFITWQIAGDMLPDATREQIVASGFNRNHMINFEGGAIPEEYQAEYVADRVETTANVFLGLTMGCARCHDHKYDPIRQRDYYRFAAFFNNIPEKGLDGQTGNAVPVLALPGEQQKRRQDELEAALKEARLQLPPEDVAYMEYFWRQSKADIDPRSPVDGLTAWYELDGNLSDTSGNFRHGRLMAGDPTYGPGPIRRAPNFDSVVHMRFPPAALELSKPFTAAFWFRVGRNPGYPLLQKLERTAAGLRGFEIALGKPFTLPRLERGHPLEIRWTEPGKGALVLRTKEPLLQGRTNHVTLTSDGTGRATGIRLFSRGVPLQLEVVGDTLPSPASVNAPVEIGNPALGPAFKGTIDDLRFYSRALLREEAQALSSQFQVEVLLASPGKKTAEESALLRDYYLTHAAPADWRDAYVKSKPLQEELAELEYSIPTTMVMKEMETPRDTYVLARGDYRNRQEKVTPGVPAMLPPLPSGEKADRLALARWLVSPEHPLTARVTVNRLWQMLFGHGIVKTSEDFGSQGEPPVHPELMDWLATEFVRSGWDVKAMMRLMVTSAAYMQSSKVTPALHDKDPENRLLARGPRFRLPAEMVRDNALAVSGLINGAIGGPSVLPYQPPGLWEELAFGENFSAQEYVQDHGDKLYRRSMYTFWKRTAPPASLVAFDAPDREKCVSRRSVTNTPLQALVTLNEPTYIEASRKLAERVLSEVPAGSGDGERLRYAFRLATARLPRAEEMKVLRETLARQVQTYSGDPARAAQLLRIGESEVDAKVKPPVLAAWTNLCTVLLNLDETITKE